MSCTKNPKKFLFVNYNGDHDYKPYYVRVFMRYGDTFQVNYRCSKCGAEYERGIVAWDELLEMGLTNEQIKEIQSSYFGTSINSK